MSNITSKYAIFLILVLSLIFRILPLDFPFFTVEEARIAARGHLIATTGRDELGRIMPMLFNSQTDYQLPLTSYLTAFGELILGKSEMGARIPFVLLGVGLVFLVYKIAKFFSDRRDFALYSSLITACCPPLIFLSRFPNQVILLVFLLVLLFYLQVIEKKFKSSIIVILLLVLTSKLSWFILIFYQLFICVLGQFKSDKKILMMATTSTITFISFILFLFVPQASRSLLENNFSIFADTTIINGINALRGEGILAGWPPFIGKIIFNKSHFVFSGLLHWISHFNLSYYFGQLDKSGLYNFSVLGAFEKVLLFPLLAGILFLLKEKSLRFKSLLLIPIIFTWPTLFIHPNVSLDLMILTLPFLAFIISIGIIRISSFGKYLPLGIFLLVILELVVNMLNITVEQKITTFLRPRWVYQLSVDISKDNPLKREISDDIVSDIFPYILWFGSGVRSVGGLDIAWPYKFRLNQYEDISAIPSEAKYRTCQTNEESILYVTKRDLNKIPSGVKMGNAKKYTDSFGQDRVFVIAESICLK